MKKLLLAALLLAAVSVGASAHRFGGGLLVPDGIGVGAATPAVNPSSVRIETNDGFPFLWVRNQASASTRYPEINATNYTSGVGSGYPVFALYNMPGTWTAPSPAPGNYPLGAVIAHSHDGADYYQGAHIEFRTSSAWSSSNHGTDVVLLTVKDGETGNPVERLRVRHDGALVLAGVLFAALGTPANGTIAYCSDCTVAATCAGSGTGALAKRLNGVWVCN